jgi:hypothetical protein
VGAVGALVAACGSGGTAQPQEVESCLRSEGLGVARQSGVSPPVETKINFDISAGEPDPERSGSVIFYASEDEATRNLEASGGSGPKGEIRRTGRVLYTPFGAQASGAGGRSAAESETLVESCVTSGEAAAQDDDDDRKKRRKKKR